MRKCRKCGQDKPEEAFECISPKHGWRRRECKVCTKERVRGYADESKRRIREYRRDWHVRNRDKVISRVNDWVKANPDKRRKNALAYYYRLQFAAIEAYGGYRCEWCGIDEPLVLTLDHVENDGADHRRSITGSATKGTGHRLYKWLRENGYPPGFQVLCYNCNMGKYRNGGKLLMSLRGRRNDYPERE